MYMEFLLIFMNYTYIYAERLSCVWSFTTLWTVACQVPLSMRFFSKNTGLGTISTSRGSSQPMDWAGDSCVFFTAGRLSAEPSGKLYVCACVCVCVCVCIYIIIARIWYFIVAVVQLFSRVWLFATPWAAALQASLSFTISQSLCKLMSIESMMPTNHLILCHLFSSYLLSFPASGSFPMSWLFTSGGQSIRASASESALPMSIQGWFPLGLTGLIPLLSKGLSRVFSNTVV